MATNPAKDMLVEGQLQEDGCHCSFHRPWHACTGAAERSPEGSSCQKLLPSADRTCISLAADTASRVLGLNAICVVLLPPSPVTRTCIKGTAYYPCRQVRRRVHVKRCTCARRSHESGVEEAGHGEDRVRELHADAVPGGVYKRLRRRDDAHAVVPPQHIHQVAVPECRPHLRAHTLPHDIMVHIPPMLLFCSAEESARSENIHSRDDLIQHSHTGVL